MNKPDLTRKQKRLITWQKHASESGINEETREEFVSMMNKYKELLADIWGSEEVSEGACKALDTLERELEELHTASRFIA
jgi:hypothetical protein